MVEHPPVPDFPRSQGLWPYTLFPLPNVSRSFLDSPATSLPSTGKEGGPAQATVSPSGSNPV